MTRHCTRRALAAAILATASATASTVGAAREPGVEQIVVTGMRTEHSLLDSPAAISVITREQIEQSGALTIAEVLRARAGLQIRDTIGDGGRGVVVSMRGFGENASNNTLVLVDGRRLNNPTLQAPDLNSVALKDIERIEILQGGGGVLFGDQAVGGVINIVTRAPDEGRVALEAGAGSFDGTRYAATASRRFDNGVGLRLSAEDRDSDNYRDNNASSYHNVLGLAEYRWDGGRVFAEGQYVDDDLEFPGALPEDMARDDRRQTLYPDDFGNLETTTLRAGARIALGEHWSAELEATDRDSDGEGYQFAPNTSEMRVQTLNPRLSGEYETANGKALFVMGLDATDSEYLLDIPDFWFRTDFRQEQRDGYAQAVLPLAPRVQASIGLRRSSVEDRNDGAGTRNSDGETITTASIAWQFRDDMRVLLRRDEVLRYPTVDENGFTLPDVSFLDPQTGVSWEGGVEWFGATLNGRAAVFDLELDDEILYDPCADRVPTDGLSCGDPAAAGQFGLFGANVNLDSSRRRGFLAETRWSLTPALSLGASYTYTDAEISSGSFEGKEVPYVSKHVGALNANWDLGAGISLFGEYAYNGSRRALGDDVNRAERVDAEGLFNAALQWRTGAWHTSLRANNLLDEEYETLTSVTDWGRNIYPAPGRTVFLTLGYTL